MSFGAIAIVFAFFVLPVLGYSESPKSLSPEAIYSPTTNFYNSQTLSLLNSKERPLPKGGVGGGDEILTEDGALMADVSPITDINPDAIDLDGPKDISVYIVREGDTLGDISEMFDISPNTIRWANDIDVKGNIKPGQELLILPISGVKYKVVKGDTIPGIAKKFSGDSREISLFNGIEEDASLEIGSQIIIPNGEISTPTQTKPTTKPSSTNSKPATGSSYYIRPVKGIKTQGPHDSYRAIDVGAKTGTPVYAMAGGTVLAAKSPLNWNGGYGGLVIIQHDNGSQTLYAHLSKLNVSAGSKVTQGQVIGAVGSTGRSTGPHLHFEIRPGKSGLNTYAIAAKMY